MFEHQTLDGEWKCVVKANQTFLNSDILELKESASGESAASTRRQYAVIGDRLVERCLPPATVGDRWSHDATDEPWWTSVNNPPHVGVVASFNSHYGGLQRKPVDKTHFVLAFAAEGEEVTFADGAYSVKRNKDGKQISAPTLPDLREKYFAD